MPTNKRNRIIAFYVMNIIFPVLIGGLIYILFRNDSYITLFLKSQLGISISVSGKLPLWLESFVRNYLADILWVSSLTYAIALISRQPKVNYIFILCVCVSFEVLIEVLQLCEMFHGTFDLFDILLEALAILATLFVIRKFEVKQK